MTTRTRPVYSYFIFLFFGAVATHNSVSPPNFPNVMPLYFVDRGARCLGRKEPTRLAYQHRSGRRGHEAREPAPAACQPHRRSRPAAPAQQPPIPVLTSRPCCAGCSCCASCACCACCASCAAVHAVQVISRRFASTTDYLLIKVFGVPERAAEGERAVRAEPAMPAMLGLLGWACCAHTRPSRTSRASSGWPGPRLGRPSCYNCCSTIALAN